MLSEAVRHVFTSYTYTRTASSLSVSLCRRHRDLEELHTREPGGPWKRFSCKHKDSSLAPQQSDRAGRQLGLDVGLPVCGGDIVTSNTPTTSESTHIYTCNVKRPCRAEMRQNMMHLWQFNCLFSRKSSTICSVFIFGSFNIVDCGYFTSQCLYAEPQNILGLSSEERNWWQYNNERWRVIGGWAENSAKLKQA